MITAQITHFPCVSQALKCAVRCKGLIHVETEGGGGWMFSSFIEAGSSRTDWDMIQKERERGAQSFSYGTTIKAPPSERKALSPALVGPGQVRGPCSGRATLYKCPLAPLSSSLSVQ